MSNRSISLTDSLYEYLLEVSLREPDLLRRLREETAAHPLARMQISPEQGQFMALLARLLGVRRCLEIGVFTGYSSLALALALPDDGRIVACDVTSAGRRLPAATGRPPAWPTRSTCASRRPGHAAAAARRGRGGRLRLRVHRRRQGNYVGYYERALELLRPGGLVLVDNTLWSGRVADPENAEPDTLALRHFNEHLHGDDRIDLSLVPIGDGLTLARKR